MFNQRFGIWRSDKELIEHLKKELYVVRSDMLDIMPYEIGQILHSYYHCKTRQETWSWINDVAEKLIEFAVPLERYQNWEIRANCPLCGQGSNSTYGEGFAVPEGLRRHLIGFGNTHHCVVTKAARSLAQDCWNEKFSATEEAEHRRNEEELARRRKEETLFRVGPYSDPTLIDDGIWYGGAPRDAEQLQWAVSRLLGLGFQEVVDERVRGWVDERELWVVYADPRAVGRIEFSVWKKPLPKRIRSSGHRYHMASFHLLDIWKNDLKTKYERRLPKSGQDIG